MPRRPERKRRRGQRDLNLPYAEYRYEVGAPDHGTRLDAFLAERVRWRSRAGVQRLIAEGRVTVEPARDPQQAEIGSLRDGLKLRAGQEVVLRTPAPQPPPEAVAVEVDPDELDVVYEDEQILAVNKPPGISVHPSRGHLTGSLVHFVHEWARARYPGHEEMPTLCHRLDRETSGLVLFAKDQLSRTRIGRQFEKRTVAKAYLALVVGEVAEEHGVIDLPLGRSLASPVRLKMAVRHDSDGQHSLTEWRVHTRLRGRTLLELRPKTGRQHQLRVHLAAVGHPILGDKLYMGDEEIFLRSVQDGLTEEDRSFLVLDRQALHSWKLELEHPWTGERVELEAPLYPDLAALTDEASRSTE